MYQIMGMECKFNVNKDKRTIVAYIDDTVWHFNKMLEKYFGDFTYRMQYRYIKLVRENECSTKFSAKATCSENDEWNEEIGKQIAYHRLYNKVYTSFRDTEAKITSKIWMDIMQSSTKFEDKLDKTFLQHSKNQSYKMKKLDPQWNYEE